MSAVAASRGRLFLRFLRFGAFAWGGPVAQIDMIRRELVEEEQWISRNRFTRVLAVYQALPGPEATELCVYFGMLRGGRLGGFLAGIAFMLPGFVLMFLLSWLHAIAGVPPALQPVFLGFQAGVVALIVRAGHRIADHALTDRWLLLIAVASFAVSLLGAHFTVPIVAGGIAYMLVRRGHAWAAVAALGVLVAVAAGYAFTVDAPEHDATPAVSSDGVSRAASLGAIFWSGLRAGALTFGGAYTVIPFLQHDAVVVQGWMSNAEFLNGLALSGILPAPLIIFATFVGYAGGAAAGALVMTVAIFAPAFGFTLLGHGALERLIDHRPTRAFLYGVTAGVVGLVAATTIELGRAAFAGWPSLVVFAAALALLYLWHAKLSVLGAVALSGVLGVLLFR